MENTHKHMDLGVFPGLDFRSFVETLRLRWWIFPVVIAVTLGLIQVQQFTSQNQSLDVVISRDYAISIPQSALMALGINLQLTEFPDPKVQLQMLASRETRRAISDQLGFDAAVRTPDEWSDPLRFECEEAPGVDCELATDLYVTKLVEIRREAIENGVQNLSRILTDAKSANESLVVASQLLILDSLAENVVVESTLVGSSIETVQGSLMQMSRRTIATAIVAALLVAILILLQLTYSDNRVRSVRQLIRLVGEDIYVGAASAKIHAINDRRSAIALRRGMAVTEAKSLRFVPLRKAVTDETSLGRLAEMSGVNHVVAAPFAELTVPELVDPTPGQSDIIVVERNYDLRSDVIEAVTALRRSGRHLTGVLLLG